MRALCLDTAGPVVVAVVETESRTWSGELVDARAQSLLELVERVLGEDRRVDAIVVGTGPGGFTGLRVGVATARGLAEALAVPLHAVPSLLVVAAHEATAHPGEPVRADVDARRGERFVQTFRADGNGAFVALDEPRTVPDDDGDRGDARVVRERSVDGLALASLHVLDGAYAEGATGDPLQVVPAYVRAPDATPPRIDVAVDELRPGDLDRLLDIEARSFPTPWTRAMYEGEFARPEAERILLAARDVRAGGRVVGAALGARIGDSWHLMTMVVDPPARRRGIARRLLDELLERGATAGAGEGWTLEVRVGNDAAISLYRSRGFEIHGTRPRYYADTGEDAFVMWRPLGDAGSES